LRAAEELHELAWTLQTNDVNTEACEKIARQASAIYALSVRQALESERMQKLASALDAASARLNAILETIVHESQVDDTPPLPPDEVIEMNSLFSENIEPPIADQSDQETNAITTEIEKDGIENLLDRS